MCNQEQPKSLKNAAFLQTMRSCVSLKNHKTVNTAALSNFEKWLYCWFLIKPELFVFPNLDLVLQSTIFCSSPKVLEITSDFQQCLNAL